MIVTFVAWAIALPLTASFGYLALEILLGLPSLRSASPLAKQPLTATNDASFLVVVPAHDEAASITATVAALKAATAGVRILVVADNCGDATAALARSAGAEVIERLDPERRGKGFALAFARDHLEKAPPSAIVILDADCRISAGGALELARRTLISQGPVQASNLLTAAPNVSPLIQISNFAMVIKNLVRARGLVRIGGSAMLFGTGMAFPWPLFSRLPLATSDAVEDLRLGLWVTGQGIAIDLIDDVRVTSPAASVANSRSQRSRWEHGFIDTARREALPLLLSGLWQRSRKLAALGAHMLIPPIALLVIAAAPLFAILGACCFFAGYLPPLIVAGVAFVAASSAIFLAWLKEGRAYLTLGALAQAPFYALWKIPIYLGFFNRRQTAWNRTGRD